MMARTLLFLLIFIASVKSFAQINAYARVTAIATRTLSLSNVSEAYGDTFENGEEIIIMQMQDNVIGSNTADNSSFGDLSAIGSAGLYEVKTIQSMTESAGLPTSITVTTNLTNAYATGANSRVQIISFRNYGATPTITGAISALAWNGNIGGVVALQATNTLTLSSSLTISANGAGFRAGARSANYYSNVMGACNLTPYTANNTNMAYKGEGIYNTNSVNTYQNGRGKILNGGGGGNHINAGGGGGGNYTSGGTGGDGWSCPSSVGGIGGIDLSAHISASRIFMGGGGGGGQQNDGNGGAGGSGGGIVLIKANQVITSGTCTARTISANGSNGTGATNDGAGGGGAGGTIVFQVTTWSIGGSCRVNATANGGTGGSVSDGAAHGGGGGGGQGRIIYSSAAPTNVTSTTNNGTSGCNNGGCTTSAPAAGGTTNTGTTVNAGNTALPVTLMFFNAKYDESSSSVSLKWATATEKNNAAFKVEKSTDGAHFSEIEEIAGAGTSSIRHDYEAFDSFVLNGLNYYRLKQIDFDGTIDYSEIVVVNVARQVATKDVAVYPNPTENGDDISIRLFNVGEVSDIKIFDLKGSPLAVVAEQSQDAGADYRIHSEDLLPGVYLLRIQLIGGVITKKLIIH